MEHYTKTQIISSFMWKWLERSSVQIIQFIIQIILARLLLPNEYGTIALIAIFIAVANVFVQNGLSIALVQKKEVDDKDFSSGLFASIIIAIFFYFILYFLSPFISDFYSIPILTNVIRIMSITLVFGAISSIQNAYIARKMKFKLNFYSSLVGSIISGFVGILLALNGYGLWALVWQQILSQLIVILILWLTMKYKFLWKFSLLRVKQLFSFGWKILAGSLVSLFTEKFYGAFIGKVYGSEMLGYYDRGHQFPFLIVNNTNGAITSVLLPTLSSKQDNIAEVKEITRKAISISSYFVFPAMMGLAIIAKPLVLLLLTDKWLLAVPFIQFECIFYSTMPLLTANIQMTRSLGRSDIGMYLEIAKAVLTFSLLILSIPYGIYIMVAGRALISVIMMFISINISKKLINYGYKQFLIDTFPTLMITIVMGLAIWLFGKINLTQVLSLFLQIFLALIIFIGLSFLTRNKVLFYLIKQFKNIGGL